ncbi:hypothetical protein LEP1GSC133_0424 [Leptospira borgpetersenii serovar Pomona str. 200901868]|uniref:Uncharacterized protein n=1 Tax=Leptospira borgpetersenii serovar Pomona str. 200901868 TaxID=1192866 RepID=M6W940_LEPBO|nr:hypothetical protein LEP1GSC133_0424 [Leptospira borgpetersenii serovar Pomona str. 200901868]
MRFSNRFVELPPLNRVRVRYFDNIGRKSGWITSQNLRIVSQNRFEISLSF